MTRKKKSILDIPDTHIVPSSDPVRMEWAAKVAIEKKADIIVHNGDLFDMPSLSSYDKGKKAFEGRRYVDDISAGVEALARFNKVIDDYNKKHTKKYKPRKVFTVGNHEDRINRAANDASELWGLISLDDLELEEHGWEVVPYKEAIKIEGIMFSHYFASGVMGRAIGGVTPGRKLATVNKISSIQGHNHVLDTHTEVRADGQRIWGMSAGCYIDLENEPHNYAKNAQHMWWSGLLFLENVDDGNVGKIEIISFEYIKEKYGSKK